MKKFIVGLAVTSVLGLTGCGGDGPAEPSVPDRLAAQPIFAPGDGEIPLPNDLLFSGTMDFTLNIPPSDAENPFDPTDPFAQLSRLDGWSTTAPFVIEFTNAIKASSVAGNVRVFKVSTYREEIVLGPELSTIAPTGPIIGVEEEVTQLMHIAAVTDNVIRVTPLAPLEPQASYAVVVTNGIVNVNDTPITPDAQYAFAKGPEELTGDLAAVEPVRQIVNQTENVISAWAGVDKESIALSYYFTTQSVYDVMGVVKQVADGTIAATIAQHPAQEQAVIALQNSGLNTGMVVPGSPGLGQIYVGQLNVPYYLTAGDPDVTGLTHDPATIMNSWQAASVFPPAELGGVESNLTYFNKLPGATGTESVPVLMTLPTVNPFTGQPYVKPDAGWPVVIFQHGITRNRTDMFAVADLFASQGYAVVAIDQPMHGLTDETNPLFTGYATDDLNGPVRERTFGVDFLTTDEQGNVLALEPDFVADPSGLHYMNIQSLSTFRDNFRQSAADLLFFAKAVTVADFDGVDGADFDPARIHFLGDSLGAIAGANFLGYDNVIQSAALAYPGGGLPGFLKASDYVSGALVPALRNAAAAQSGLNPESAEFEAYFASFFESFLFAATTIGDPGDPVNHAAMLALSGKPLVVYQVPGDTVVPNNGAAVGYPLTGTEPLAANLGLAGVTQADLDAQAIVGGESGVRAFVKFNTGTHGNLVNPAADATVRDQMQQGALGFFANLGTVYPIPAARASVIDID